MNPGSCTDHHLSNAMKHAVDAFDPDIERALVNIYMDVGGAPGRGLKRKKHFEKICLDMGIAPIPIKKVLYYSLPWCKNMPQTSSSQLEWDCQIL